MAMNMQQTNTNRHTDGFNLGRLPRFLAFLFPSMFLNNSTPNAQHPTPNVQQKKSANLDVGSWALVVGRSVLSRSLFTLLTLSLLAAVAPQAEAVEATNTGGYVTTYTDAGGTWIYHVFTNAGASGMKFRTRAAGGTVELLVVAGGGSGGGSQYDGGAGGAGGLIYSNSYAVTANTDYGVTVGLGGAALGGNSTLVGNPGQNSIFGSSLTAYGGGGGGNFSSGSGGTSGGSGGGGAGNNCGVRTNGGIATVVSPMQGNKGGNGYPSGGAMGSGGGGGAGYAGGDGTSSAGGNGGDGLYIAAFTNWGDTNTNYRGWFAGGGGGGVMSGSSAGTGGKGGGGQGGPNSSGVAGSGVGGQPNTGGGGGGPYSHNTSAYGGAGGSGIVIVRYQSLPPVLPYSSSGDILYATNLNGRLYGLHIFTNTVGTNYFTTTKDLNVEYLVIGGGGGGGFGTRAGGGGAGGYRCSVPGEWSGSLSNAEPRYAVSAGVAYPVVVGAGGGIQVDSTGYKGRDSWFTNIVSTGGGGGKERSNPSRADGGSGGGGGYAAPAQIPGGSGTPGQGFSGGNCGTAGFDGYLYSDGGGGGGAGSTGTQGRDGAGTLGSNIDPWGSGGTGLVSSITGVAVGRAGGGGGAYVTWGAATNYGGGLYSANGAPSTGGGGGASGNGGSGVVILRYDMTPSKGTVIMMR
jgi:hypothetical protein